MSIPAFRINSSTSYEKQKMCYQRVEPNAR